MMAFLLVVLGLGNAPVFYDPDTAWHIAAGDLIRLHHKIPLYDTWSFTADENVWYNISWLFDITASALFSCGGFSAIYAITIVIFTGCMAIMTAHSVNRGASLTVTSLLMLPMLLVLFTGTLARPNVCSAAMTVTFYLIANNYSKSGKLLYISILPVLMAIWVNLHGGFLFAFPLLTLFLAQSVLEKNREAAKTYIVIIALCLLATLINPYGFGIYYGAYKTISAPFNKLLTEWKPVEIGHNLQMTVLLVVVLCAINITDRKIAFADRALTVFITILSLASMRHSTIAALLLMPCLSLRISGIAYGSKFGGFIRRIDATITADMEQTGVRVISAAMLTAICVMLYMPYPRDEILSEPAGFPAKHFPLQEAAYIAEHYPDLRFFNDYNIGGYLDYIWHGQIKVFIDGRANSVYSDDTLEDYKDFMESGGFGGRAEMILHKYKFDGLIIANDAGNLAIWLWNPSWKVVYKSNAATVFLRSK